MFEKPTANYSTALVINFGHLLGVELMSKGKTAQLIHTFDIPLDSWKKEQLSRNAVELSQGAEARAALLKAIERGVFSTALTADNVLIRSLDVKLKKDSDIDDVLAFQVEPLIPFAVSDAVVDRMNLEKHNEGTLLTALAVKKEQINSHLTDWKDLQMEPEVIGSVPSALSIYAHHFYQGQGPIFVLHLGEKQLTSVLTQQGRLIVSQSANIGFEDMLAAYSKDKKISIEEAKKEISSQNITQIDKQSQPYLSETMNRMQQEALRLCLALNKQARDKESKEMLVCGYVSQVKGAFNELAKQLKLAVLQPVVPANFGSDLKQVQELAVPLGLAFAGLSLGDQQINFRQDEYAYPNPWKRLKTPLMTYLGLCFALALSAYLFGQAYIGAKEDEVKNRYAQMLKVMNKDYFQIEKEILKKQSGKKEVNDSDVEPLKDLTIDDIGTRLEFISNQITKAPKTIPLMPQTPRVSDVLAWLNSHENVVSYDQETGAVSPLLQLENIHYALVKRPDPGKPRERYQVQIELEFSSKSPKWARQFHDALIAPNDLVDNTQEVKWNAGKDRYRASFFLKDKTSYP